MSAGSWITDILGIGPEPASPCKNICKLDFETGTCIGCHRKASEIGGWNGMTRAEKRAVLSRLEVVSRDVV